MKEAGNLKLVLLAVAVGIVQGCIFEGAITEPNQSLDVWVEDDLSISHSLGEGILRLVNDPSVDADFLNEEASLDHRAASEVVERRRGFDGVDGSADDELFNDLFELDAVRYIDTFALVRLGELARDLDLVPSLILEGVPFSLLEEENTLLFANFASFFELDTGASLDVRAVEGLVQGRPFDELTDLLQRPFIGPSSLRSMRDYSKVWLDERLSEED
jgi:hypothetical protein